MRTPEEIKKGLDACLPRWNGKELTVNCDDCAYKHEGFWCRNILFKDAVTYIQQLEADNESKQKRIDELESRLVQAERERDAAMDDARNGTMCDTCKHNNSKDYLNKPCYKCDEAFSYWEWRGVCPENTKEG